MDQPLLEESSTSPSRDEVNNNGQEVSSWSFGNSSFLLVGCTLALVLLGITLILLVAFLPVIVILSLWTSGGILARIGVTLFSESVHLKLLWSFPLYLRIFRTLLIPIRKLLFPLVIIAARIESIRDNDATFYAPVSEEEQPLHEEQNGVAIMELSYFRKSVRRHYRRMQKIFERSKLKHEVVYADRAMRLVSLVPILWDHEKRVCADIPGKNPVEEFVKRFLVVTLLPDGILDLYYDSEGNIVNFQFSVLQGNVLHWFMYFSTSESCKNGIWWHGALLALVRGFRTPSVRYVNAQCHQSQSKLHAGYRGTTDNLQLDRLYPFQFSRYIPDAITNARIWISSNLNDNINS